MSIGSAEPDPVQRLGRQPSTTVAELSHIGLQLFIRHGFDETTVDDIASAAGIGRRTFFRYFPSKNDLPWGDFDGLIASMSGFLTALPPETPLLAALRQAILEFNRFPDVEEGYHRARMTLLLTVPTLVGHSTLRFAAWRRVVAEFAGARLRLDPDDLRPQLIAWTFLALSIAAYEEWLRNERTSLLELLARAIDDLGPAFPFAADA